VPDAALGLVVAFFGATLGDVLAAGLVVFLLSLLVRMFFAFAVDAGFPLDAACVAEVEEVLGVVLVAVLVAVLGAVLFLLVLVAAVLAAGLFLAAAVGLLAVLVFATFFVTPFAGNDVLFLVAAFCLTADLALVAKAALGFLDLSALSFALGAFALSAFAGVLAFTVFLGFATMVGSTLLGHKKPDQNRAQTLPEVIRFAKPQIQQNGCSLCVTSFAL